MIQETILSSLIFNESYARKVIPYLKKEYFADIGEQVIHKLIRDHFIKYNKSPTIESITVDLENSSLIEPVYNASVEVLKNLKPQEVDEAWLVDNTEEFCKRQAFFNAVEKCANLLQEKKTDSYGKGLDFMQEAMAVTFDTHIGHDYFEDVEDRFRFYHQKTDHLPCDLDLFNKVTDGGFVNKSMTVFLAPTGIGKSLFLCHFAAAFLAQGKNVLYITMEMPEEKIAERIDANLLDVPLIDLKNLEHSGFMNRMNRVKKKVAGRLVIKEYPSRQAHAGHFRHLINELKLKKKFIPDVIMVDYLGITASATLGKASGLYEYQKVVSEEIRGLGLEFNCRIFTAAQVNREGTKEADFSHTDIADSWGITNSADYIYGIMSTEELEKRLQIKIKRLKDRYMDYITWYPSFLVGIDRGKMRLFNLDDGADTPDEIEVANITDENDNYKSKFSKLINN